MSKPARDADRNYAQQAPGSSPAYRAGFDQDASERQGPAGRPRRARKDAQGGQEGSAPASGERPAEGEAPTRRRGRTAS